MSYAQDRKWSDRFLPAIRALVGPHLLIPAPLERDMKEASDLIVLRARDMTIACRVRRPGYADVYPWDVTLRSRRDTKAKTELQKLREGWGDWMFYGHSAADEYSFERWFLIDLHVWRGEFVKAGIAAGLGKRTAHWNILRPMSNGDGTHFVAFDLRRFPFELIIASSHVIEPIHDDEDAA